MLGSAVEIGIATKRCVRCCETKPVGEFHRRGQGVQSWCKPCHREWDAKYHSERRHIRAAQKRARKQLLVAWLRDLKSSRPCADCGGYFHPAAMTFDHLPGRTKRDDVSNLLYAGYRQVVLDKIAKCELVCANCHAVRTFDRERSRAT
jgi:hypothetical protein